MPALVPGLLSLVCIGLAVSGCGKPRATNPLDAAGGPGHGNYFPMEVGRAWKFSGTATVQFACCGGPQTVTFEQDWTIAREELKNVDLGGKASGSAWVPVLEVTHRVVSYGSLPVPSPIPTSTHYLMKFFTVEERGSLWYVVHFATDPYGSNSLCLADLMERVPHVAGKTWQTPSCLGLSISASAKTSLTRTVAGQSLAVYPVDEPVTTPLGGGRIREILFAPDYGPVRFERCDYDPSAAGIERNWYRFPPNWGALTSLAGDSMDLVSTHAPS